MRCVYAHTQRPNFKTIEKTKKKKKKKKKRNSYGLVGTFYTSWCFSSSTAVGATSATVSSENLRSSSSVTVSLILRNTIGAAKTRAPAIRPHRGIFVSAGCQMVGEGERGPDVFEVV